MHTFLTGLPSANFQKAKTWELFSWIFPTRYLIYYFIQSQHSVKCLPGGNDECRVVLKRKGQPQYSVTWTSTLFFSVKEQIVNILSFESHVQLYPIFVFGFVWLVFVFIIIFFNQQPFKTVRTTLSSWAGISHILPNPALLGKVIWAHFLGIFHLTLITMHIVINNLWRFRSLIRKFLLAHS